MEKNIRSALCPVGNSTFSQLLNIQDKLNKEITLKELLEKSKNEILKEIEDNCQYFFIKKIEKAERIEFISEKNKTEKKEKYEMCENINKIICDSIVPLKNFFFMIRNENSLLLDIISHCDSKETKKLIANLITSFCYENILSTSYVEDSLLAVIYLVLEKEISVTTPFNKNITDKKDENCEFSKLLFRRLGEKEDIKAYFSIILNDLLFEIEKEDAILQIDLDKIEKELLGNQITNTVEEQPISNDPSEEINQTRQRHKNTFAKAVEKEINSYKEKIITSSITSSQKGEDNDDYNSYFEISNKKNKKKNEIIDINQDYLQERYKTETDNVMKGYFLHLINKYNNTKNKSDYFMNNEFFRRLRLKEPNSRRIFISYNTHCNKLKGYLSKMINILLSYLPVIPKSIKIICKMMTILLKKKDPQISILDQNIYISKYFFGQLFLQFLLNPLRNGLLSNTILSVSTKETIILLNTLIIRLLQGKLFTSSKHSDFTTFNSYMIELMPTLISFFEKLIQVKVPLILERLCNEKDNPKRNINYSYLKENKEEYIEHQSMCLNWNDINFIFDLVKDHPNTFNQPKYSLLQTHFRKLSFHFDIYKKFLTDDKKNDRRSFIILTNINYEPGFKEKLNFQQEENMSFQAIEGEDTNLLILPRIKYCFRKILGSLQTLSKEDFSYYFSIEDIVALLNRMLELEEISGSFNDSKIPFTWYGLYLKTNLHLLPNEYKNENYTKLFREMIQETEKCFKEFDNTVINKLRIKTKNLAKKNRIINFNLFSLKQIEKFFHMKNIVEKVKIPICLCCTVSKKQPKQWHIYTIGNCPHDKTNYLQNMLSSKKQTKLDAQEKHLNTIQNFIEKFPNIKDEYDLLSEDISLFDYQEKINIPVIMHQYYGILLEHLKTYPEFSQYNSNELNSVLYELTSYIISKIYKKLYSVFPDKKDKTCFDNCVNMDWIQPHHLIKDQKVIDEELWKTATKYLNQMDREMSPLNKINAFSQASKIIHNSITFCSGKTELGVDDSINVLLYVVLKSKPQRLISNLHFMRLYLNKDLSKKDKGILMTELDVIANFIEKSNYKMVDGMSEEEFKKNCENTKMGLTPGSKQN